MVRRLITVADDFGLSEGVNEAVEQANRHGILTSASLMAAGPAAADAVKRARSLPGLHVGLHVVVIEGAPVLAASNIPDLVDASGCFPSDQLRLGVRYFFSPRVRRQLAAEIRAQFEAFRRTGLTLDHVNAHKHMHLHPTVGAMIIAIGREYGLRAIRVPSEGSGVLRAWTNVLRGQARRAGLITNDSVLGLADTGHMTSERVRTLLERLPEGLTEMYFHPATVRDATLEKLMPEYEHEAEFRALMDVRVLASVELTSYGSVGKA